MSYSTLSIDVTAKVEPLLKDGRQHHISAWVFAPDTPVSVSGRPVVIFLLNGGTYDKRYFHFQVPGAKGYSTAEALQDKGYYVVLLDHLGVGESSRADNERLVTRHVAASANHSAVEAISDKLSKGQIAGIAALGDFVKVGGGHSMGGFVSITQQAAHKTYDGLLVLGYTAVGVHLSHAGQVVPADQGPIREDEPQYYLHDRSRLHESFHWDDVPDDVVAVDDGLNVEVPCTLSRQSTMMGIVTDDAAKIDVPVYICLGERDVSPNAHAEPSYYTSSSDVTLHILPKSGHCQSFASTRQEMFDRIDTWIGGLKWPVHHPRT